MQAWTALSLSSTVQVPHSPSPQPRFVPVAPALLAAVNDALQTDLTTLPLTPEKIIRAVQEKRKEASL